MRSSDGAPASRDLEERGTLTLEFDDDFLKLVELALCSTSRLGIHEY
jgi:hypothetical protein